MPEEEIVYASHYETKKRINPIIPVVAAIVVIVVVGCIFFFMNRVDFKSLYNKYCSSTWATVGSDGSYLNIDTNPFDVDDTGIAYYAAYQAIQDVK